MPERVREVLPEVRKRAGEGRMLDAWELARGTGVPLEKWPPGEALREAARLASALGAGRLSQVMHWRNWRHDRKDAGRYHRALFGRSRFVPLAVLHEEISGFLESAGGMGDGERADLLAFLAAIHVSQRDFNPAEKLMGEALALNPRDAWLRAERSSFLAAADRYGEALEEAEAAVALEPFYRVSVTRHADALIHLGRDGEALECLMLAHEGSQQAAFPIAMQVIFSEREDHARALWCLEEVERLSPLMEPSLKRWIASRKADFHLMAGREAEFLSWADRAGEGFQKSAAEHFRSDAGRKGRRKRLDVAFVRQHRSTCAPATLAAISAYWGVKKDHLEIADAICYEGTPWHKERRWAEGNGFVAREFRLTRENLVALIDRGVPFTLTTQWVTGAHLQACIGYDSRTDVVLLRDPTERHFGEMRMEGLLSDHPIAGPRAMVMVPADRGDLLEGIVLDDELAYDSFHRLLNAIDGYGRLRIEAALAELRSVASPGHPLAWEGELRASQALEDWRRGLVAVENLLERFPEHEPLWRTKCHLLANLRRTKDYRRALETIASKPKANPVFRSDLGELLVEDARELAMADFHLRRALLRWGGEGRNHGNLARCRMKERRFGEAARLQRAASCLTPAFEPYAYQYFEAARIVGKTAEALEYLEERTATLGRKDHGPWITLARAYDSLHRPGEAAAVLEKAALFRPDDGLLLLHGGRLMVTWGPDFRKRGREWMELSRGKVSEPDWLKETAEVAGFLGERRAAIRHWRALLAMQPARIDVWRALSRLIAEEEGSEAAIAFVDEGLREHPEFLDLWALSAEWLSGTARGPLEALRRFVELDPKSAWGYRELALRKLDAGDAEGALADAEEGLLLDPHHPASSHVAGLVLKHLERREEAAERFRASVSLSVDATESPEELVRLAGKREEALEALRFIESEMRRQVSNGGIVSSFQNLAWRWIEPPELLEILKGFRTDRPDLWQTWAAVIDQSLRMELLAEAREAAVTMTEVFPLMPRAWLELGRVHEAAGNAAATVTATGRAVEISPGWDEAARAHAEALERVGELAEAEATLRKAVFLEPLNVANHGYLADLLRRMGRRADAVEVLRRAMKTSPFYGWGWGALARWAVADGREAEIEADLEEASAAHGHRRSWWPVASDAWDALGRSDRAIQAIRRALELSPEDVDLADQLAALLTVEGRYAEALEACEMGPANRPAPVNLRGRRAWVLMRSGQPVGAIREMKELLESEPQYAWGLAELTSWLSQREDWKGMRDVALRWARHLPREHRAYGYLGQAEENLGDFQAAEKAYAKAFVLQPEYGFAGRRLMDIQMKARRFDEARETLGKLRHYAPDIWLSCDAVELELRAGAHEKAMQLADSMLGERSADYRVMDWLRQLFEKHGDLPRWIRKVRSRLKEGGVVAPGALAVVMGQLPQEGFARKAFGMLKKQPVESPMRIEGWARMIELAAALKEREAVIRWSVKNRDELRSHALLWREMGGAFLTLGEYLRGEAWLADWRERPGDLTAPVFTWYAALCDGAAGKYPVLRAKAEEARREGLSRYPDHGDAPALRAGLAFHRAVSGDVAEAEKLLAEFEPDRVSDYYRHYAGLAQAVVSAARGDEDLSRSMLTEAAGYFSRFVGGGPAYLVRKACEVIGVSLSRRRGKAVRLRRAWKIPMPKESAPMNIEMPRVGWGIVILVIVAINAIRECSG